MAPAQLPSWAPAMAFSRGSSCTLPPTHSSRSVIPCPLHNAQMSGKSIPASEVAKHKTEKDCWVIIKGNVYDVTKFLPDHPGGKKAILMYGGKDATSEFEMLHKPDFIEKYGKSFRLGPVA